MAISVSSAKLAILHLYAKSAFGSQDEVYVRFFLFGYRPGWYAVPKSKIVGTALVESDAKFLRTPFVTT
jgi:hypothetical protein